jgi:hypothetical protein
LKSFVIFWQLDVLARWVTRGCGALDAFRAGGRLLFGLLFLGLSCLAACLLFDGSPLIRSALSLPPSSNGQQTMKLLLPL